jgi:hypothetical protein
MATVMTVHMVCISNVMNMAGIVVTVVTQ